MKEVLIGFEWLDIHFALPTFDLLHRPNIPWKPCTLPWLSLPWYDYVQIVDGLYVYYDGSAIKDDESGVHRAGAGVLLFVRTPHGWYLGGGTSHQLAEGSTAYQAELAAATIATKMTHDLLKIVGVLQHTRPVVTMCYDNQSVGHQAAGKWSGYGHPKAVKALRALVRLCEQRFGVDIAHSYVAAHSGDPGNEGVDTLAQAAARCDALDDWGHFLRYVSTRSYSSLMESFWLLFRSVPDVHWDGTDLCYPPKPVIADCPPVPTHYHRAAPGAEGLLTLRVATCNALTLKSSTTSPQDDTWGPSRQQSLLRQFGEQNIHIVAFQETRLRRTTRPCDEHYWLFPSPATREGHFGMMLAFHKDIPLVDWDDGSITRFVEELTLRIEALERQTPDLLGDRGEAGQRLCDLLLDRLDHDTRQWAGAFVAAGGLCDDLADIHDVWLGLLSDYDEDEHDLVEQIFLDWGHGRLPDLCDALCDGEVEGVLDAAFAALAVDLPRNARLDALTSLQRQRQHAP
eukprot:Skav222131  [mRNA]  locus=scaffold1181:832493:837477:+ [translate_table: standard]